jgi:peptidoglycan hydrolase-like protein with peptidoglycan-binding domain
MGLPPVCLGRLSGRAVSVKFGTFLMSLINVSGSHACLILFIENDAASAMTSRSPASLACKAGKSGPSGGGRITNSSVCLVSALQLALAALGFDVGTVDGSFSETTAAAVRSFQENQGTTVSGVVDDTTWELLGRQPFEPDQITQVSAEEFPSIVRALAFAEDVDGYLQDLGIDAASINDDEPNV